MSIKTIIRIIRMYTNLRIIRIKINLKLKSQKSKLDIGYPKDIRCPKYSLVKKQNETILSIILSLRGAERRSNPNRSVASLRVLPKHREAKQPLCLRHVIASADASARSNPKKMNYEV